MKKILFIFIIIFCRSIDATELKQLAESSSDPATEKSDWYQKYFSKLHPEDKRFVTQILFYSLWFLLEPGMNLYDVIGENLQLKSKDILIPLEKAYFNEIIEMNEKIIDNIDLINQEIPGDDSISYRIKKHLLEFSVQLIILKDKGSIDSIYKLIKYYGEALSDPEIEDIEITFGALKGQDLIEASYFTEGFDKKTREVKDIVDFFLSIKNEISKEQAQSFVKVSNILRKVK